jgi:hypothetical protein
MSVTVDHEQLDVEQLGLRTVGQVLSHLQGDNRLVVNLLIDGQEPDLDRLCDVRRIPVDAHTLFIETADPRDMAMEVLAETESQLADADRLKGEAVDLLQRVGAANKAMEKLSGCFRTWHNAHESVVKTAQLLRIDLGQVRVDDATLAEFLSDFTGQLRQIKLALEARDFVTLGDVLSYDMADAGARWGAALGAVRDVVCGVGAKAD